MKHLRIEAAILALSIVVMGWFFRSAVGDFIDKDRTVTVKGLAEMEVEADKVIWPIEYKETGNDPVTIYGDIERKNAEIVDFLVKNGITQEEISVKPPRVLSDRKSNTYDGAYAGDRYVVSSVITVTSSHVGTVRSLMKQQSELMKRGIAVLGDEYSNNSARFEYTQFNEIKPKMIEEATKNARQTAEQFAHDSESRIGKIKSASQGQFSIEDRDPTTPHIQKIRVVTTIVYTLKD